ncbi:MAG: hypothetical protein ACSLFH_12995 [Desulfuromonadales bacterium]
MKLPGVKPDPGPYTRWITRPCPAALKPDPGLYIKSIAVIQVEMVSVNNEYVLQQLSEVSPELFLGQGLTAYGPVFGLENEAIRAKRG